LIERLTALPARPATPTELLRVHTEEHVSLAASSRGRTFRFDPDTQGGPRSYDAALLAAGAAADAVDRVLLGEIDRAFCAVRPPGHHAEADRAMGFCLFNNVAVAAAHALGRGLTRVAIIDFDVHHGNGTQSLFERDPRVLYASYHACPLYPGPGAAEGRAVFVLEGGYELDGIARSSQAVARVLLGDAPEPVAAASASSLLDALLAAYREQLAPHWPVLRG